MVGWETWLASQLPTLATAEMWAAPHGAHHSPSHWDHAQLHHMTDALRSCLWRGQLSWEQHFDKDNLTLFQEPAWREAWGDVHTCPISSPFPAMWVLVQ